MLEYLQQFNMNDFDTLFILPGPKEDSLHIEASTYKEFGEKVDGSSMGDAYHIILFKEDTDGELVNVDRFDAIFVDPLEYMSDLIEQKWFGIIAKKTTTSENFIKRIFDKLSGIE